jgi:hypothetical protein
MSWCAHEKYQSDPVRAHPNRRPGSLYAAAGWTTIVTERRQTAAPTNKYCDSLPFKNARANVLALGIVGFGVAYGLPKVLMRLAAPSESHANTILEPAFVRGF